MSPRVTASALGPPLDLARKWHDLCVPKSGSGVARRTFPDAGTWSDEAPAELEQPRPIRPRDGRAGRTLARRAAVGIDPPSAPAVWLPYRLPERSFRGLELPGLPGFPPAACPLAGSRPICFRRSTTADHDGRCKEARSA